MTVEIHSSYDTAVVGCGPASLGLLVAADRYGQFEELVEPGVAFIERGKKPGSGALSGVQIKSNSAGEDFVSSFRYDGVFSDLVQTEVFKRVADQGEKTVPLSLVAQLIDEAWKQIERVLRDYPASSIIPNATVTDIGLLALRGQQGAPAFDIHAGDKTLQARQVVLANGAHEKAVDLGRNNYKQIPAHDILTGAFFGSPQEEALLRGGNKKVVILGSSHSAFAAANELLAHLQTPLSKGDIKILHRSPVRLFYNSVQEAIADGYPFDLEKDVCPKTGRVYRYSGIREDARGIFKAIVDGKEERVSLHKFSGDLKEVNIALDEAAVVVTAIGYDVNLVPFRNQEEQAVGPRIVQGRVDVDAKARILDFNGQVISRAFALGLGHGLRPNEQIGGEPSAENHPVDSINLYHGLIAEIIYKQILETRKSFNHL